MKGKLAVLAGVGVGYVLGARAGRQRYEQMRSGANRLWHDPRVAEKRHQAAHVAKDQAAAAAHVAKDQAAAAKDAVTEKVTEKVHKSPDTPTNSVPADDLPDAPSYPV